MSERLFYTPKEAAALLDVHEKTILRYLAKGTIEGVQLERVWRIYKKEFDEKYRIPEGRTHLRPPARKGKDGD